MIPPSAPDDIEEVETAPHPPVRMGLTEAGLHLLDAALMAAQRPDPEGDGSDLRSSAGLASPDIEELVRYLCGVLPAARARRVEAVAVRHPRTRRRLVEVGAVMDECQECSLGALLRRLAAPARGAAGREDDPPDALSQAATRAFLQVALERVGRDGWQRAVDLLREQGWYILSEGAQTGGREAYAAAWTHLQTLVLRPDPAAPALLTGAPALVRGGSRSPRATRSSSSSAPPVFEEARLLADGTGVLRAARPPMGDSQETATLALHTPRGFLPLATVTTAVEAGAWEWRVPALSALLPEDAGAPPEETGGREIAPESLARLALFVGESAPPEGWLTASTTATETPLPLPTRHDAAAAGSGVSVAVVLVEPVQRTGNDREEIGLAVDVPASLLPPRAGRIAQLQLRLVLAPEFSIPSQDASDDITPALILGTWLLPMSPPEPETSVLLRLTVPWPANAALPDPLLLRAAVVGGSAAAAP